MYNKFLHSAIAAGTLMLAAGAQAQDGFTALSNVKATPMTEAQMSQVEGKAHVYLKLEKMGVMLPELAEMATRAAAPAPNGGDFTRSPSRDAQAFVRLLGP